MKTEIYMNVFHHKTVEEFADWVRKNGLRLIAIDNQKGAENLSETDLPENSILVFGNESEGLSAEMLERCENGDRTVWFNRSVNVGVASGILMYEFVRRNNLLK